MNVQLNDLDGRRARFSVRHPEAVPLPEVDGLLAGAAEVDITPPPGLPKAGYSANAHTGTGFRTRLRARVVHLRSGTSSVALVALDLLGGSAVLQHLIAERIRETTDVPLAGLFLGATHTHAGPGQFLGTDFYNNYASNKPGFDPRWAAFLVDRIAGAVEEAVRTRVPAVAAWGTVDVWGWTRNRSMPPYVRNNGVTDKRTDPQRKYVSFDPGLQLLRVDGIDGAPLAGFCVFGVHGTGISMKAREYNADLWAYLVDEWSRKVGRGEGGAGPVLGAVEGTHADVAPALRPGGAGHVEAERVGRGIGACAAELYERLGSELSADFPLGVAFREVDLTRSRREGGVELPERPAVGASLVAGATENLTPVVHRIKPFGPGMPRKRRRAHPQGAKWVLGGPAQRLILPLRNFPRVLPLQVLRLGGGVLVGVPFEVTTESGARFRRSVQDVVGDGQVIVASVANEYSGYVATPEEYEEQFYEGGHTLYGPTTEPFLSAAVSRLAGDLMAGGPEGRDALVSEPVRERSFDLKVRRYLPEPSGPSELPRRFVGAAAFTDPTLVRDAHWEVRFTDVVPSGLVWHEPVVAVECSDGEGPWEPAADDQGTRVEVEHLGAAPGEPGAHLYAVRYYAPELRAGRRHRVVLLANNGRPRAESPPFD